LSVREKKYPKKPKNFTLFVNFLKALQCFIHKS